MCTIAKHVGWDCSQALMHIVHKCLVLQSSEHAAVFTLNTDTIRSFFAKQDWSGLVIQLIVLTAWNFDSSVICDNYSFTQAASGSRGCRYDA